ncbi:MAG: hypothetical protein WC655_02005 [Candidatus Hydrogenedentales bacterium]
MKTKLCTVCQTDLHSDRQFQVTVKSFGMPARTRTYCGGCAARYLDTVDLFGMTVPLIDSVRVLPAA